jgi:hypothetical protein
MTGPQFSPVLAVTVTTPVGWPTNCGATLKLTVTGWPETTGFGVLAVIVVTVAALLTR